MIQALLLAFAAGLCLVSATPMSPWASASPEASALPPAPPTILTLPILELSSPNQDDRPAGTAIDTLIVHDTETPGIEQAKTVANHFLNPRSQVSAHYIIGKKGEVVQCVPDMRRAWHAGPSTFAGREKVNDFSIGIELVNAQTGRDPFTDAQYASLIALSADLVVRHGISLSRITGHRHVTNYPKLRRDPADNFDWQRYLIGVASSLATQQVQRVPWPEQKPRHQAAAFRGPTDL